MNTGYRGEGCYSCSFSVSFKLHQNKMFKILCAQVPNSEYVKGYIVKRCHYPIALLEWRTFPFQRRLPHTGFPGGSVVKNPPANAGDVGLIPGSGRSPREENGNPLRCSCLGNPIDRGAWGATDHGFAKESDTTQQLNNNNNLVQLSELLINFWSCLELKHGI